MVHGPDDLGVPIVQRTNHVIGHDPIRRETVADQFEKFFRCQMLRNGGAVATLGVRIQNDEIPLRRVAPQEDAPIRDLNFLPVRFFKIKKLASSLNDEWINFGGFDFYIWV